jgi:hypothetical protein
MAANWQYIFLDDNTLMQFLYPNCINNNLIQVNDLLLVTHISGGTVGAYNINAYIVGDFIGGIWIRNITSGSLSESLTLQFMLLKSATA